jgi:8-oxo-dGTP diphosphatase
MVRPSAYLLVRNDADALAVVRTRSGFMLPGGGIETGETPADAARREAAEECGLVIDVGRELARATEIVFVADEATCYEKRSVFFQGRVVGHVAATELDHELIWLDRDAARATLSYGSHRWVLDFV